jgi:hypothetical protein
MAILGTVEGGILTDGGERECWAGNSEQGILPFWISARTAWCHAAAFLTTLIKSDTWRNLALAAVLARRMRQG